MSRTATRRSTTPAVAAATSTPAGVLLLPETKVGYFYDFVQDKTDVNGRRKVSHLCHFLPELRRALPAQHSIAMVRERPRADAQEIANKRTTELLGQHPELVGCVDLQDVMQIIANPKHTSPLTPDELLNRLLDETGKLVVATTESANFIRVEREHTRILSGQLGIGKQIEVSKINFAGIDTPETLGVLQLMR